MKLTFYNHYGNGDLFESREFCLDWMKLAGVTEADYAHRPLGDFFSDLPQIKNVEVVPEMNMRRSITWGEGEEGQTLWVNTWIGRDGQYVINPGVGCTVEELYRMHNDMLREAKLPPLPRSIVEYIPTIDYARCDLGGVKEWLDGHRGDQLVLLCNGPTGSGHASNFDFGPMLDLIPEKKGRLFIFTQPCPVNPKGGRADVFLTTEMFDGGRDNLNAISYLSRHCSVMAGRCSGPHDFCMVLPNWMDSTKTLVCFTNHPNGACFIHKPERLGLKMKVVREGPETPEDAASILNSILK